MANLNPGAIEETSSLMDHVTQALDSLTITTKPVVICGVQRKINIGNYENIDIYCGLALPVDVEADMDTEAVMTAIEGTIRKAFHVTSSETMERYQYIKDAR